MRKYTFKFQFSDRAYKILVPGLGKNLTFSQRVLEISTSLRSLSFLLVLLFLPISMYFYEYISKVNLEGSLLAFVTIGLLITGSFYLFEVFFSPKYRVIDPKGSFTVLIFGLLVTASSAFLVFTDYESSENTFGDVSEAGIKGLAGLTIIMLMAVYYLINLEKFQNGSKTRLFKIMASSFFLFNIVALLDNSLSLNLFVFIFSIPFLLSFFVYTNSRLWKFLILLLIGFSLNKIYNFVWFEDAYTIYFSAVVITSLIISYFVFSFQFEFISMYLKNYFTNIKKFMLNLRNIFSVEQANRFLKITLLPLLIILPISILILALFIINDSTRTSIFSEIISSYELAYTRVNDDLITLITGTGAGQTSSNFPFFSSVLIANGIIGLVAYTILYSYGIIEAIKSLLKEAESYKALLVKISLATTIVFIPVLSIFIYPSIFAIFIWWIAFSILLKNDFNQKFIYSAEVSKSEGRISKIFKPLSLLTLFIICYILVYTVIDNLGILF